MASKACSYCESEALPESLGLPYPLCDQHFAYVGMMRVRPVTFREHLRGAVGLFAKSVWRDKISANTAWSVAWGGAGGTTTKGVRQPWEVPSGKSGRRSSAAAGQGDVSRRR